MKVSMFLGYSEKNGSFQTVDNLQKYFCHGWCNTVVATDSQLGISDFCSEYAVFIVLLGCSQKGSCCLQHFSFAEYFINTSTARFISWETESRSLNDSPRLQCYTWILGLEHGSSIKCGHFWVVLLSVLIFARRWFITILDVPAYALLTRGKAFAQFFPVEKHYDWRL